MRCERQQRFLGKECLEKVQASVVAIVGAGSLGSRNADAFARIGVKRIILIDDDDVSKENISTQIYEETDEGKPKVNATAARLKKINPKIAVDAVKKRLDETNAAELLHKADMIIDGTDNYATRYIINEYCVEKSVPWVMGACAGSRGIVAAFVPGGPCLSCVMPVESTSGEDACSAGVLGETAGMVSALQVAQAVNILSGNNTTGKMVHFDILGQDFEAAAMERRDDCFCSGEW